MKIYTRTGDKGTTGLFGGTRLKKDAPRLQAYGTVDELNACIGLVTAGPVPDPLGAQLEDIQRTLFILGTDLATPSESKAAVPRITAEHATTLEQWIDRLEATLAPLTQFILPGGSSMGAHLHLARTVCRRAERWLVSLQDKEVINPQALIYVNRLSDYLFVAARYANKSAGTDEKTVALR